MDQIILLEYVASIDNGSSREILSALATANNRWLACKVKLSLTSQASWQSITGTDYRCPRLCQRHCPRYVGVIFSSFI